MVYSPLSPEAKRGIHYLRSQAESVVGALQWVSTAGFPANTALLVLAESINLLFRVIVPQARYGCIVFSWLIEAIFLIYLVGFPP